MYDSTAFAIKAGNNDITLRVTTVAPLAIAGLVSSTARLEPSAFVSILSFIYKTCRLIIRETYTESLSLTGATLCVKFSRSVTRIFKTLFTKQPSLMLLQHDLC
jgi:hypothetical protein